MIDTVRKSAQSRVQTKGLPKVGDEEWRFTPLASFVDKKYERAKTTRLMGNEAASLYLAPIACYRLVFSNGTLVPELSRVPTGITFGGMLDKVDEALLLGPEEQGFGALATFRFKDGPYINIPKGIKLDKAIHVVYCGTATEVPQEAHYRGVFVLGAGASATIVEETIGRGAGEYFHNSVSRVELAENSSLEHYILSREPETFVTVRALRARLRKDARLKSHVVALGGALTRNDIHVTLAGEGSDAELNGLYLARGTQHFDFHTTASHQVPHGTCRELYKGVLDGKSHAVFNGLIEVAPDAQKTEASVYNRNLLLSEDGLVNTKPEFKIHANDVQCKHGATIGQLREDALFYLRSRGIGTAQARSLLTYAFASEMLGRMNLEPVREALAARLQTTVGLEAK